jgi:hypothetical protein
MAELDLVDKQSDGADLGSNYLISTKRSIDYLKSKTSTQK